VNFKVGDKVVIVRGSGHEQVHSKWDENIGNTFTITKLLKGSFWKDSFGEWYELDKKLGNYPLKTSKKVLKLLKSLSLSLKMKMLLRI
jgi:hypothetical protein